MTHSASLTIFVLLTLTASRILAQNLTGFIDEVLTTPCPKAISDFTAVVNASTGKVYLAGGCDSTNGNQYNTVYGKFVCGSISNKSYIFDLNALAFTTTADMPVARYRHAAVLVNNQVWLVGGRDINDNVIATVDVSITQLLFKSHK